jgi:HxlR-like helix-turn-helix
MSRSVLIKRLADLERAGVIVTAPKPGGGSTYRLTAAGRDVVGVVEQLGAWGTRWLDVTTEQCDPGFALWAWCQSQMAPAALPRQRTVVAFTFPAERPANRRYWILVEDGVAELCCADPGGVPDVDVVADSVAFVEWHRGARSWAHAMRSGAIVARARHDWSRRCRPRTPTSRRWPPPSATDEGEGRDGDDHDEGEHDLPTVPGAATTVLLRFRLREHHPFSPLSGPSGPWRCSNGRRTAVPAP